MEPQECDSAALGSAMQGMGWAGKPHAAPFRLQTPSLSEHRGTSASMHMIQHMSSHGLSATYCCKELSQGDMGPWQALLSHPLSAPLSPSVKSMGDRRNE